MCKIARDLQYIYIERTKDMSNKKTSAEILKEEISTLASLVANLGNASNVIPTADLNADNPDAVNADKWEKVLDDIYLQVADFAESVGVEL